MTGTGLGPSSIRIRIVAAFLAAMLAMAGAMAFLIVEYQGVSGSQALITEGYLPLAFTIDQLGTDLERVENDVARLLRDEQRPGTGTHSPTAIFSERLQDNLDQARIHAQQAQQMAEGGEEHAVLHKTLAQLGRIDQLREAYLGRASAFVALAEAERREAAEEVAEPLRRDGRALDEEIEKLAQLVDGRIQNLTAATEAQRRRATAIAGLLAGLAFLGSLTLLAAVLYALRPIARLTAQVQRLAAGDYSGRVEVRGGDEIAVLATEFNAMVAALELRDRTLVERAEELNRLSRYLGSVLDNLEDALVVVEDGRVTLANPAAARTWAVVQEQPLPSTMAPHARGPGPAEQEAPDGSLHEIRGSAFGDSGIILVSANVTEQRRAEARLARSERLALVGQMLAQITHEVRNPLNALSLNAELLAEELGMLDPDRKTEAWDLLGTVSGEIDRLTDVTAHYLALARRPPAHLQPADLPLLLEDVARLLDAELRQGGVHLELAVADPGPQLVDGNQIRQALLNGVRNAVESGARHLVLSLGRVGSELVLCLEDDGPGMTSEEIDRATDPFFSTKASGTGLGLAITRQILEDHDGAVRIESSPGQGTRLSLALPWRPAAPPSALAESAP